MFKAGNVVIAKSGGPLMTVETVDMDIIKTVWFDDAELREGFFSQEQLILIRE